MNKRKKRLIITAVIVGFAVLFSIGLTISYLVDTDVQDNVITIGKVSLKLDEGDYVDNTYTDAQQIINKAPSIENDGTKDEFVFLRVLVPKDNVTLLYEQDVFENNTKIHSEGEIIEPDSQPSINELFKLQTNDEGTDITAHSSFGDIVFSYHSGESTPQYKEGWVKISGPKKIDEAVTVNEIPVVKYYDEYIFGYNKKLSPTQKTVTLFDKIQLKSFIDEEIHGEYKVNVSAYGIQTENLGLYEVSEDAMQLTEEQLRKIFNIVDRKQVL